MQQDTDSTRIMPSELCGLSAAAIELITFPEPNLGESAMTVLLITLMAGAATTDYQNRKITVQSSSGDPAHVSMSGVHRIASLLKRWILGTHQGSVVPEHLQAYLEELPFRFNRCTYRIRGLVFRKLLELAVATFPVTETM